MAKVAALLGTPLLPWQRQVADVACEIDARGLYRYGTVVVSVPRQSGKTTLVLANGVERCLMVPNRRVWHTAQTGQDAREKFLEMAEPFAASQLGKLAAQLKRGAGNTRLVFRHGSTFRPHPPTMDALHGQQSDLNNVDEAWVFDEAQGANLVQAIIPTQATRPGAQTWVTSTMGTADSTWFHDLSDRGRAGEPGICYFEWSIPDDADPDDLEAVAAAHPAYGHLIDMEAIRRARAAMGTPAAFARAYGNRRTATSERVIPLDAWIRAQDDAPLPSSARPVFGAAVAWDRTETAILAAVEVDGLPVVEVVDVRPGTSWAVDACEAASTVADGAAVVVDGHGPSGPLADHLEQRGVPVIRPRTADVTTAAADLYDRITHTDPATGVTAPRIRFRHDSALSAAVDCAARRLVGDGAWTWGRRTSTGSIAALEAATLAVWGTVRDPGPAPAPRIYFG
ncbi:terminase large subunit domain-containing protein [Nocardia wallacei]|uniref:terminase large subunit domain-containing protein n=1 Tax=Nocardia wallacei TaxID=480035 RepID=UPI0024540268|nr:terminase family protein [Nocardia wallacei]